MVGSLVIGVPVGLVLGMLAVPVFGLHPPRVEDELAHLLVVDRAQAYDDPVVREVLAVRHHERVRLGGDERLTLSLGNVNPISVSSRQNAR